MRNYYLFTSGQLKRKDNTVLLKTKETVKYIPVDDIDGLFLFGEYSLNTRLLNFFSQKEVILHLFNYYDYYTGSYLPRKKSVSGALVVEQAAYYLDFEKRLYIARQFIEGAVIGIIRNLSRYQDEENIKQRLIKIKTLAEKITHCQTILELMAIEGNIRHQYYQCFETICCGEFTFKKRVKHPPDNEINSLISFVNSLVYTEVLSQIYRTQLEPTISYLHQPHERRFSLSLDLAEIFKPFLGDRMLFKMLNHKQICKDDFVKESNGLLLTDEARKKIMTSFSSRLTKKIKHRTLKRTVSYRALIRLECYKLIKHLLGDKKYKPFRIWW